MKYVILVFFLSVSTQICAQGNIPTVPSSIEIAEVKLKITDNAKKIIQKDVNALRASDKYFRLKLDRVNLYFPIIERVLREEGVPEDIKYLSIQESALISDAVSSSNAVGYWQFKDFTAREVGLRVDNKVDERKNIVAATHGAAKYFKRNNFFFKNWIYSVSAYQAGAGGAKKYVNESNYGSDNLTITSKTHWYVLKFIAHVIAFQDEVGAPHSNGLQLTKYSKAQGKSIRQVGQQFGIDENLIQEYNKWLAHGSVPDDKTYYVIVPVKGKIPKGLEFEKPPLAGTIKEATPSKYPDKIAGDIGIGLKVIFIKINGLEAIMASANDDLKSLADKTKMSKSRLMKYNDLTPTSTIKAGEIYYTKSKRNSSLIRYHIAQSGETLWDISQKYGIKIKKLAQKNRMELSDLLKPGRVMWLTKNRPSNTPIEYHNVAKTTPQKAPEKTVHRSTPVIEKAPPLHVKTPITSSETESSTTTNHPVGKQIIHVVQDGQTLWAISTLYEASVQEIQEWNNLTPQSSISPGQELSIFAKRTEKTEPITENTITKEEELEISTKETRKKRDVHTVQPGESLWAISKLYNLTIGQLQEWNNLPNNNIKPGQQLVLQSAGNQSEQEKADTKSKLSTYTVKGGDSLYKISKDHNMTVEEIMKINGLESTSLSVGTQLRVKKK